MWKVAQFHVAFLINFININICLHLTFGQIICEPIPIYKG